MLLLIACENEKKKKGGFGAVVALTSASIRCVTANRVLHMGKAAAVL
jgi:hypothetical protein